MVFGKRSEMQFRYWDEKRKGISQSEISRKYNVTRQTISKAVKVQEREVLIRLLDISQVSSILPEWYSVEKGILIGTIPLLNNSKCLLLIDVTNKAHLFYDPDLFGDPKKRKQSLLKLLIIVKETVGLNMKFEDFHMILEAIIQGG
jgi:transcriptional regulator with XRE-family HTH domain